MKHEPSLLERAAELYGLGVARAEEPALELVDELLPGTGRGTLARSDVVEGAWSPSSSLRSPPSTTAFGGGRPPRTGEEFRIDRLHLAEAGFLLPDEAVTGLAEEVRLLKRKLLDDIAAKSELSEARRRTVLIASAQTGDGKTFCAVNLALSLAGEREVEVLLIDADVAKPAVAETLGLPTDRPGLVDALADPSLDAERLVLRTDLAGLSVLPAGRRANNVPELLASARTRDLLAGFVERDPRRIILIDSPPALAASAATILAGHAGHALVVVRADRTTEADLREAVTLLGGAPHLSLLLNAVALGASARRYGGYYGGGDAD